MKPIKSLHKDIELKAYARAEYEHLLGDPDITEAKGSFSTKHSEFPSRRSSWSLMLRTRSRPATEAGAVPEPLGECQSSVGNKRHGNKRAFQPCGLLAWLSFCLSYSGSCSSESEYDIFASA